MKEIASGASLLLLIQGVGGIINRLAGGGPSWFLVKLHRGYCKGMKL